MKQARGATRQVEAAAESQASFALVATAFAKDRSVTRGGEKGFGAGSLKVNGRIFAMIASKGELVVKLPKARVDALIAAGKGERFDPRHGRPMKEWLVVKESPERWVEIAKEARRFVGAGTS